MAFIEKEVRKEVRFDDMFLVDLTQLSTGVFRAMLAVRVKNAEPF